MKFDIKLYDLEFFKWHFDCVHTDCLHAGKLLKNILNFDSVYDFGCGIGSFLQGIKQNCKDVQGYEISKHAVEVIDSSIIKYIKIGVDIFDLKDIDKKDLSLCLEVAEHIEQENSYKLVNLLCDNTNKYIIFSAATKDQQGTGHINCQDKSFWIELFENNKWYYNKELTESLISLWCFLPQYYINNLIIFVK